MWRSETGRSFVRLEYRCKFVAEIGIQQIGERIIGEIKEGEGTHIVTRLGGSRVLDVLYGEGLPRIC